MKKGFTKSELICSESLDSLPSLLNDLIEHLKDIKKDAKNRGYTDVKIDFVTEWGYYDDHWIEVKVRGKKPVLAKEFINGKKQCIKST